MFWIWACLLDRATELELGLWPSDANHAKEVELGTRHLRLSPLCSPLKLGAFKFRTQRKEILKLIYGLRQQVKINLSLFIWPTPHLDPTSSINLIPKGTRMSQRPKNTYKDLQYKYTIESDDMSSIVYNRIIRISNLYCGVFWSAPSLQCKSNFWMLQTRYFKKKHCVQMRQGDSYLVQSGSPAGPSPPQKEIDFLKFWPTVTSFIFFFGCFWTCQKRKTENF